MSKINIGIIGCGAVSEKFHIPVASASKDVNLTALVDKNVKHAEGLAKKYGVSYCFDDYRSLAGKVDAVIVAVPHHLHAPIAIGLLEKGIHVLVEKPMALTSDECERMNAASRKGNAILAVGLVRRFLNSHRYVKELISGGFIGKVESFDIKEGGVLSWPIASDFFYKKESGGGVLLDTGAHTLDTLLNWLGDYESFDYCDNSMGGVESDCRVSLLMKNGARGTVELSRTRSLRNTAIITGSKATLEVQLLGSQVSVYSRDAGGKLTGSVVADRQSPGPGDQSVSALMAAQLANFAESIKEGKRPLSTGDDAIRSVRLIESCYRERKPLDMPWDGPIAGSDICRSLKGKKVLVTGATGFIGGRLVECLVRDCRADVRVLVRNYSTASRIGRFPVKMMSGDVTDRGSVKKAMEGCEIVFHCAYGNQGGKKQQARVNVEGTENVMRAAMEANVKRIVHVSTLSVYGNVDNCDLTETTRRKRLHDVYSTTKRKGEAIAFKYYRKYKLPVSVIQPTIVYGPQAPVWTINPVSLLSRGRFILADSGNGLCNAVFVDDVIQAMLLAAVKDEAVGQAFLISSERPATWKDFFKSYEKMIGSESTVEMSAREIGDFMKKYNAEHALVKESKEVMAETIALLLKNSHILKKFIGIPRISKSIKTTIAIMPEPVFVMFSNRALNMIAYSQNMNNHGNGVKPIMPMEKRDVSFYRSRANVRIDKAKQLLGYRPRYDLETGMGITRTWLEYACMIHQ
jgi:predicted dehydrogenase/nucleoside-diphosphate-sugar epimerase